MHARGRVGQDERFADFEVLDDERAAFKQLHARFEDEVHEARRREDDVAVHLVILRNAMWRASSRAVQVGVARGRRISSSPRPPGARRPSRQSLASCHQRLLSHA